MCGLSYNEGLTGSPFLSKATRRVVFILLGVIAGTAIDVAPRLYAALFTCIYPPDKNILVNRSFEPDNFPTVSNGSIITITITITNSEDVALRGFYYSDQVPNGWVVNTADVLVNGSSITSYTYQQGYATEIYTGFTPHRWTLEMPRGDGIFSPTHPILASGGAARIVYTLIVSGGIGSDYSIGHDAWAGWLETDPTGTAVFGYQGITGTLNADLTTNLHNGATPLTVQFTDLSTGGPTSWIWDFGDGLTSTVRHPTHTYTMPGQYGVTLTASGPSGSDTVNKPDYITVTVPPPTADFTTDLRIGATPLIVRFTDLSTDDPTSWAWDFGDGLTSTIQHPTHTYILPGQFGITLTVSGPGGSDTVSESDYITVTAPPPTADFTADLRIGATPLTVQFTDLSTGDPTSWTWDFGDGLTSTIQHPIHTYTVPGQFGITLTVSGPGSSDTVSKPDYITVTAPPPTADFTADLRNGAVPLTIQFTDLSTGDPTSWTWDFGDGLTSTIQHPTHTYTITGQFGITLTASSSNGSDTVSKPDYVTVTALSPTAGFTTDLRSGATPLTIQFTDLSTGDPTSWAWDFGDGLTSTIQHPTHTYTIPGQYGVTLTVSSPGCSDTVSKPDYVTVAALSPTAGFTANLCNGAVPLTVQFTDLSTGDPTSWAWDFGDGLTSTIQHPPHTYTITGQFGITLTVNSSSGSDTVSKPDYITVTALPPTANFTVSSRNGTAPFTAAFIDLSTSDITARLWDFGDGLTSTVQHPTHTYTILGQYGVTLTVSGPGGSDMVSNPDYITVATPLLRADFIAQPRFGLAPLTVRFTDLSVGDILTRVWNFGDHGGTSWLPGTVLLSGTVSLSGTASLSGPTYTYSALGYYTVSLIVQDAYGVDILVYPRYIHVTDVTYDVCLPLVLRNYAPQHRSR